MYYIVKLVNFKVKSTNYKLNSLLSVKHQLIPLLLISCVIALTISAGIIRCLLNTFKKFEVVKNKIEVGKNVKLDTKVPKHVLFSYVENAIKHGLALKINGILKINSYYTKDTLVLIMVDNGGGLGSKKSNPKHSTGNGLLIMEQIFDLYSKLNKKKIKHQLTELTDDNSKVSGLKFELKDIKLMTIIIFI